MGFRGRVGAGGRVFRAVVHSNVMVSDRRTAAPGSAHCAALPVGPIMRPRVVIHRQRACGDDAMAHGHDNFLELQRGLPEDEMRRPQPCGFDAFSREQYGGLLNFLRKRVASEEDARDAAQESLMRLMRYRDAGSDAAWKPLLYRIAVNVVGEQFRRSSVRQITHHVSLDDVELVSEQPSQEELVLRRQQEALLKEAILSLPARSRQVYLLSRMQGMTYAQIARHCAISVKTVEKHMTHALASLCERIGSEGGDAF